MRKLLLCFLPLSTLLANVFAGKEPAYALIVETLEACKGTNLREYAILDHLRIFPNHTSSGYIELIEPLPTTATIKFQAYSQNNDTWTPSPLSIEKLDLCRFIEKDVWFVPMGRLIVNIPERCPVRKGYLRFKSMIIHKRTKGIMPAGCFRAKLTIMDKNKPLICIDTVTRISEYSKRYESTCAAT